MDNVRCTGTEMSLIDCPHSRSHSCSHHDDAAVQCQTSKVNQQQSVLISSLSIYCMQGSPAMMVT